MHFTTQVFLCVEGLGIFVALVLIVMQLSDMNVRNNIRDRSKPH